MSTNTTTSGNTTSDQQAFEQHSHVHPPAALSTRSVITAWQMSKSCPADSCRPLLARHGADKLWHLPATEDYVPSLGA